MEKNLVEIIKNNPGCVAVIDNDSWWVYSAPPKPIEQMTQSEYYDEWIEDRKLLAQDGEVITLGDGGYGSGNSYGGDILQALAVIAGVKIKSV